MLMEQAPESTSIDVSQLNNKISLLAHRQAKNAPNKEHKAHPVYMSQ